MNDVTKLSRQERITALALPGIKWKLKEAHKLITAARSQAADLVNIDEMRGALSKSAYTTSDALGSAEGLSSQLIKKATS